MISPRLSKRASTADLKPVHHKLRGLITDFRPISGVRINKLVVPMTPVE